MKGKSRTQKTDRTMGQKLTVLDTDSVAPTGLSAATCAAPSRGTAMGGWAAWRDTPRHGGRTHHGG